MDHSAKWAVNFDAGGKHFYVLVPAVDDDHAQALAKEALDENARALSRWVRWAHTKRLSNQEYAILGESCEDFGTARIQKGWAGWQM